MRGRPFQPNHHRKPLFVWSLADCFLLAPFGRLVSQLSSGLPCSAPAGSTPVLWRAPSAFCRCPELHAELLSATDRGTRAGVQDRQAGRRCGPPLPIMVQRRIPSVLAASACSARLLLCTCASRCALLSSAPLPLATHRRHRAFLPGRAARAASELSDRHGRRASRARRPAPLPSPRSMQHHSRRRRPANRRPP